ncbi:MAG: DUF5779 family protein [Halobacteriaceae archaeon]
MSDGFDLDLRHAEDELPDDPGEDFAGRVVLGVLDGSTAPEEWLDAVEEGDVLLLSVEGDLNELAAPFARDVRDAGGTLTHYREFLVVAPSGVVVDTDRLP